MEQLILTLFLALFTLEFLIEFGLNELNLRHVRACWDTKKLPKIFTGKITADEYDKSVQYTLAKGRFQRWSTVYDRLITLVILFAMLAALDRFAGNVAQSFPLRGYSQGIIFCLTVGLVFITTSLPTDLYSTFGLEAKFGFNKTTVGLFVADKLKALILGLLIGVPFLFVVLWLMQATGDYWWLWAVAFISAFQLLMIVIFPTFIAPWFNKFEPLKEGEFRERILAPCPFAAVKSVSMSHNFTGYVSMARFTFGTHRPRTISRW